jgi:hypothetical protein
MSEPQAEYRTSEAQTDAEPELPPAYSRTARLARHAGFHALLWLAAFSAFAAADSWNSFSGLGIAGFLSVITGIIAGVVTSNLIHEWFHLLGAWRSGGNYEIPEKLSLFVYDWTFSSNNVAQFKTMSIAGSLGSVVAIILLWVSIPADTAGRTALVAASIGSLGFAAAIEWPVLRRVQASGDPLAELSKIDLQVLRRSAGVGVAVGAISWLFL